MPSASTLEDMLGPLCAAALAGYFLGSLPFGYLVARSRGVNIFAVGSCSPGATNVRRVLGPGPGNTVFVLDLAKGAAAAGWPLAWYYLVAARQLADVHAFVPGAARPLVLGYVGLAFAIAGHAFSCFTGLRGGKGVATAAGGLLVLMPYVALVAAALWVLVFFVTRYVSLASILAALSLPLLALLFRGGAIDLWVTVLVALFVVVRHRANVARLLQGTERKFERRPAGAAPKAEP